MHIYDIAASIVVYKNDPAILNQAIESFLNTPLEVSLLIIDNSPTDSLKELLVQDPRISYVFNNNNVGYSKAHNQGIRHFADTCKYFLVLNPDVYFSSSTLSNLYHYLEDHPKAGLVAPRILYPNGDLQTSRRLIPNPIDLMLRRVPVVNKLFKKRTELNEFQASDPKGIMEVPFVLGCFLLFRMDTLNKTGLFDERYFMYLEDLDICRRLAMHTQVVYNGQSYIYHFYQRDSSKNLKMFLHHIVSMIKYFHKWGWFNDTERAAINSRAIEFVQIAPKEEQRKLSKEYATTS
jgi:GT2 family glycosyltransferase